MSNVDTNQMLSYVCNVLRCWGIKNVQPKTLTSAKKNKPDVVKEMSNLLFGLCILHIFDFQYDLNELKMHFDDQQTELQEKHNIILAHLSQLKCPYLVQIPDQQSQIIGFNLFNSYSLLMVSGWLLAISNFFEKIERKLTKFSNKKISIDLIGQQKAAKTIIHIKNNLTQMLNKRSINVEQKTTKSLCLLKSIELHLNRIHQLQQKYNKLSKITKKGTLMKVQVISQDAQRQFVQIMKNQMKYMRMRQYFWAWLDQNVLPQEQKELKNCQFYQPEDYSLPNSFKQVIIQRDYLNRFIKSCNELQYKIDALNSKYQQIFNIISSQLPTNKKSKFGKNDMKDIQNQIRGKFNKELFKDKNCTDKKCPSFVGIQLSKHMQISLSSHNNPKKANKQVVSNNAYEEILTEKKSQIRNKICSFVQILDDIKFI